MRIARAAIAACLLLSACETQPFFFGDDDAGARGSGVWIKPNASAEQRQDDMRECRQTALAQVERDRRIDEDIDERGGAGATQGTEDLLESMQSYGYTQRRDRLFESCMQEKGYRRE